MAVVERRGSIPKVISSTSEGLPHTIFTACVLVYPANLMRPYRPSLDVETQHLGASDSGEAPGHMRYSSAFDKIFKLTSCGRADGHRTSRLNTSTHLSFGRASDIQDALLRSTRYSS